MPYPSEHAARIIKPIKTAKYRRQNDRFGKGKHVIWMVDRRGKTHLQAIRFDADKFSPSQAKAWLKKYDTKYIKFEPATGYRDNPYDASHLSTVKRGLGHAGKQLLEPVKTLRQVKMTLHMDQDESLYQDIDELEFAIGMIMRRINDMMNILTE